VCCCSQLLLIELRGVSQSVTSERTGFINQGVVWWWLPDTLHCLRKGCRKERP
jgi:hypothetical protein